MPPVTASLVLLNAGEPTPPTRPALYARLRLCPVGWGLSVPSDSSGAVLGPRDSPRGASSPGSLLSITRNIFPPGYLL